MEKLTTLYQNYSSNVWGGRKSGDYKKKKKLAFMGFVLGVMLLHTSIYKQHLARVKGDYKKKCSERNRGKGSETKIKRDKAYKKKKDEFSCVDVVIAVFVSKGAS